MTVNTEIATQDKKRGLIICRVGDRSLHKSWLEGLDDDREWDLHLSYYGKKDKPETYGRKNVTWSNDGGTSKFSGIAECVKNNDFDFDKYDYVAIPDDDILASMYAWNRGFELCRDYKLGAAQLANHKDSFFSYDMTLERSGVRLRYVSRVESQMPIYRTDIFKQLLHYFTIEVNLWGIDFVSAHLLRHETKAIAILDECVGLHTRAHGVGSLYAKHRAANADMYEILDDFLKKTDTPFIDLKLLGAIDIEGRPIENLAMIKRRLVLPKLQQIWRGYRGIVSIAHNESEQLKALRPFSGMPELPRLSIEAARGL